MLQKNVVRIFNSYKSNHVLIVSGGFHNERHSEVNVCTM